MRSEIFGWKKSRGGYEKRASWLEGNKSFNRGRAKKVIRIQREGVGHRTGGYNFFTYCSEGKERSV